MVCVDAVFKASSDTTILLLMEPLAAGSKSTAIVHEAPEASVSALDEAVNCKQVDALFQAKLAATLGFVPEAGTVKLKGSLPILDTVAVCVPSAVSVEPTLVAVAQLRADDPIDSFRTRLFSLSST